MPTGRHPAPRTLPQAPVPLLIFRKIYLYGKSKKSTHHHRNTKPFGPKNLAAAIATLYLASLGLQPGLQQPRALKLSRSQAYPAGVQRPAYPILLQGKQRYS